MRRRLYLMRHAEVAYFRADGPPVRPDDVTLTADGRRQAAAARDALAGARLDRVIASDLPRAIETARIVAPALEPEIWTDFREWRGGRLRDVPEDELEAMFVGALHVSGEEDRFLGGESLREVLDRVLPALDRLVGEDWDSALAVLHGGINRVILSVALAGGRSYFGAFEQAPACINVLDVGPPDWIVRTVNYIPYDPLYPARQTTMEQLWEAYSTSRLRRDL